MSDDLAVRVRATDPVTGTRGYIRIMDDGEISYTDLANATVWQRALPVRVLYYTLSQLGRQPTIVGCGARTIAANDGDAGATIEVM